MSDTKVNDSQMFYKEFSVDRNLLKLFGVVTFLVIFNFANYNFTSFFSN